MVFPLFRNYILCHFESARVAFGAEGAACFMNGVGMGACSAVGGVPCESLHHVEFVVAGQAGYGCGNGTEADLAGPAGKGRHCCGWEADGRAKRRWWWWVGWVAVERGSCGGVAVGGWIQFGGWMNWKGLVR